MKFLLFSSFFEFYNQNFNSLVCDSIRITNFETLININLCFFNQMTLLNDSGSCIYLTSDIISKVLIENCYFHNCTSLNEGGSCYINLLYSNVVFNKNCGSYCYTTGLHKSGQFLYSIASNNYRNEMFLQSYSYCSRDFLIDRFSPIYIYSGNQLFEKINGSKNFLYYSSSFYTHYPSFFSGKFCNFINNSLYKWESVSFGGNKGNFSHSNVIQNNSPTYGVVLVWYSGSYIINDSIFIRNTDKLFEIGPGSILIVFNCWIQHPENFIGSPSIYQSLNNYFNFTSTYQILHFITGLCYNNFQISKNSKFSLNYILIINILFFYF